MENKTMDPTEPIGDIEVEKILLGVLIINNGILHDIADTITDDNFLLPIHQKIYKKVCNLIWNDLVATPLTLKQELKDEKVFEAAGISCYDYLRSLVVNVQFVHDIKTLANIIHNYYIKRCLVEMSRDILKNAYLDGHNKAHDIVEMAHKKLIEIGASGKGRNDSHDLNTVMHSVVTRVSTMYQEGKHITGVTTGFTDLDAKTGGMQPSDLVILAARPSMGKTSLAINMCINAATSFQQLQRENNLDKPQHVLLFSLEMSAEQLVNRILAVGTGIDSSRLRTGNINKYELEKLMHGQEKRALESLPMIIDDSPSLSITALKSRVVRLMRQYNIGIIMVDYLQLLSGSNNRNTGNRVHEIGEISQGLKALAREMNIPVIALSQLSRAVENRDDKKPQLSDLRDSGNIEQDADIVMFLYREEYYLERKKVPESENKHLEWQERLNKVKNIAEIVIAKQRNGPIGSLALHFNSATTAFTNLSYSFDFDD
jgi:replicative DNA helicase